MTEWGILEAVSHLDRLYERLEVIRKDLGRFVSYEDECRADNEGESILSGLTRVIQKMEDTTNSIRTKVDTLLEEEPK